jgi:hypothetical protein
MVWLLLNCKLNNELKEDRTMKKVFWILLSIIAVLSVTLPLHADPILDPNDPYLTEDGSNMATTWGNKVVNSYTDPISGMSTLTYFFRTDVFDPSKFTPGDWAIKEAGTGLVGDLVRFEILSITPPTGGPAYNQAGRSSSPVTRAAAFRLMWDCPRSVVRTTQQRIAVG